MVDDQQAVINIVPEPTEADLMAELDKVVADAKAGKATFKEVAAVSRKVDLAVKAKEKAELAAKTAALDSIRDKVGKAIDKAVKPLYDSKELDEADGVWYSYDFGEQASTVRLMKSAPRASRPGGGGGGKKFDISTDDMLSRHGDEPHKKEEPSGPTLRQAYESSTDKNWRYAIRQKLLKLDGVI